MSGGVDSALTAAIFKHAGYRVVGVTMPIHQDAAETARGVEACSALGIEHRHMDLSYLYDVTLEAEAKLDPELQSSEPDKAVRVRRGNVRARLRMVTLYNLASKLGGMVASTDNLSELSAGFWTLHGDVGDFSPIQALLKSWEVPYLARLNGVPESTVQATPTDGLGIDAGDEAQLGCSYLEWDLMIFGLARDLPIPESEHRVRDAVMSRCVPHGSSGAIRSSSRTPCKTAMPWWRRSTRGTSCPRRFDEPWNSPARRHQAQSRTSPVRLLMSKNELNSDAVEPLLAFDSKARAAFVPYRKTLPVRVLSWLSEVGDQPQLRSIAAVTFAVGLVRSDARMMRAAARMLLAHELATVLKNAVKDRVDRGRPRSASNKKDEEPRPGGQSQKEETSFPSGHSAGAMAAARAFSSEYPKYKVPMTAVAASVGLAQIPRCAHYPSDVAAGFVIGAVADAAVGAVWRMASGVLRR